MTKSNDHSSFSWKWTIAIVVLFGLLLAGCAGKEKKKLTKLVVKKNSGIFIPASVGYKWDKETGYYWEPCGINSGQRYYYPPLSLGCFLQRFYHSQDDNHAKIDRISLDIYIDHTYNPDNSTDYTRIAALRFMYTELWTLTGHKAGEPGWYWGVGIGFQIGGIAHSGEKGLYGGTHIILPKFSWNDPEGVFFDFGIDFILDYYIVPHSIDDDLTQGIMLEMNLGITF